MNFERFIDFRFVRSDVGNVLKCVEFLDFIYNFVCTNVHKACV